MKKTKEIAVAKKSSKEVANRPSQETLDLLKQAYPIEPGFNRIQLPRLGMYATDVKNGKGKDMKVVNEAGEFYIDRQSDELDKNGKKKWVKEELGTEIEATVVYQRKQLSYYDQELELYTSSPVYDTDDEIVPLFCDKKQVDKGLPADLQAKYPGLTRAGKPTSKLEVIRVLYVIYKGELYQMSVRGTSMYSFLKYIRTVDIPPAVLTKMSSEAQENGSIAWNQMTFETIRDLNGEETNKSAEFMFEIKKGIGQEKSFYAKKKDEDSEDDE